MVKKIDLPKSEIKKKYNNGLPATRIAEGYDCSSATIQRRLEEMGEIQSRKLDLEGEKIRELYQEEKHSISEIADYFDCSPRTIRLRMMDADIERRGPSEYLKINHPTKVDLDSEEVLDLYKSGETVSGIARKFGCSRTPILRILKEHGIEIRSKPNKRQDLDERRGEIKELYVEKGFTVREIAKKFESSNRPVRRILKEEGVDLSIGYLKYDLDKEQIIKSYKDGKSLREIAEERGCENTTILHWLKKWNVSRRSVGQEKGAYDLDLNESQIRKLYLKYELSTREIADRLGVSQTPIQTRLRRMGVLRKPPWPSPNTKERRIRKICRDFDLPFYFVGNQELKIGELNPDFINCDFNLIIEHFGTYWHGERENLRRLQKPEPRKDYFADRGFATLILWEDFVNESSDEEIASRIEDFYHDNIPESEMKL